MKKIKSVLLPGEFFKNDYVAKTEKLMSLDIDTLYLYDHGKNPAGSDLDVYRKQHLPVGRQLDGAIPTRQLSALSALLDAFPVCYLG